MTPLLSVDGLSAGYGDLQVLHDVDLHVAAGEVVSLVGANGAGKTTLLTAISRGLDVTAGGITFDGMDLRSTRPHHVPDAGLVLVPEGRRLFPFLTVEENLVLGAYTKRARKDSKDSLSEVYELFPKLLDRRSQLAGSLSGGEQQMCALGRGLMARPTLLALDEPSLGLAPIVVDQIFDCIQDLVTRDITILIVEQNVSRSLELSDRAYVLDQGRVVMSGSAQELKGDPRLGAAYLGEEVAHES
ncbi:ABC transporter ATP-binding protein [Nocardioides houyundeii]|uniref:ABC transporter ATP-binding protein n=1 Tax=Nocardioides houyundeii TaxID=2045452 RepID=UPI000DF3FB89|nr:ABC transporter ATP-binding protein [Nocardioides houyundeii]